MKFIRKYSNNIIKDDTYSHRKDNYDELKPEEFEVSNIIIRTDSHVYNLDSIDIDAVIESFNYFTIVYKQLDSPINSTQYLQKIIMLKYNQVENIEFLNSTIKDKYIGPSSLDTILDNFWKKGKGKLCD